MIRGDIYWVDLTNYNKSFKTRPCVIISDDTINDNSNIVIVATTTTRKLDRLYPNDLLLDDSKVTFTTIFQVPKSKVLDYKGHLTSDQMDQMNDKLKLTLGIGGVNNG